MRKQPQTAPPKPTIKSDPSIMVQHRHYRLITPLFGGGVKTGVNDPVTIIRGSGIRGHLRFWWRACRGGLFDGDLAAMKREEDAIWGAASTGNSPSSKTVEIAIEIAPSDLEQREDFSYSKDGKRIPFYSPQSPYGYVAFPFQDFEKNNKKPTIASNVQFTLSLRYPREKEKDVEAALWAWETFGGVGGRTRRGFGALCCDMINGEEHHAPGGVDELKKKLRIDLPKYVVKGRWPAHVPHLSQNTSGAYQQGFMLIKIVYNPGDPQDALAVWRDLIAKLKGFRQAKTDPKRLIGRSAWPEADALRRLVGPGVPKHAAPILIFDKFPRAVFGLPIVFAFKHGQDTDSRNTAPFDPNRTTLQAAEHRRLASPILLRPLIVDSEHAVGVALLLSTPQRPPSDLILLQDGNIPVPTPTPIEAKLDVSEARQIRPLSGKTDVLKAFLDDLPGAYL